MKYEELTRNIISCAMEVHNIIGNGFQSLLRFIGELIYQRALQEEFMLRNISFIREYEMDIFYKGTPIGTRRVDFLVDGLISVELKAIIEIEKVHLA